MFQFWKLLIRIARNADIWDKKDKSVNRDKRYMEIEQALKIIDFRNRLRNTLETNTDPLKHERLERQGEFDVKVPNKLHVTSCNH